MIPTLRQLQYLSLLAEHGSFSRAAEAAHVTQPTLSAGVQELERILGAPVVDRARSKVILTRVGEETARRGRDMLQQAEDLVEAAQTAARPLTGRFRLGAIPTIAPFLLPKAIKVLRTRHPQLQLYLREEQTQRLLADLRAGDLDAALIALPYDVSGLDWAHVFHDELLAATPLDHPLAKFERVSPADLADSGLLLLEDGHCLRDHALAACGLNPPRNEEGFSATSMTTLIQMVGSGLGVSFLPAMAVQAGLAETADVAVRPIAANHPSREIVICWRAGSSRGREAKILAQMLAEDGQPSREALSAAP